MPRFKRKGKIIVENPETLDQLNVDQTAWVKSVDLPDGQMRRRLQDLGIIEGTRVVCKQAAPSGNPKSFLVRGAVIAIRTEDSKNVFITTEEPKDFDQTLEQKKLEEEVKEAKEEARETKAELETKTETKVKTEKKTSQKTE